MRIELRIEGGFGFFPGLAQPFALDTEQLPPEEAARLARLLERAQVLVRPAAPEPPARRADARRYRLAVEAPGVSRALVLHDPLEPELAALVDFLRAKQRASRRG